jgi:hypothetical protein
MMFLLLNRAKSVWVPLILRVNSLEKKMLLEMQVEKRLFWGVPPEIVKRLRYQQRFLRNKMPQLAPSAAWLN